MSVTVKSIFFYKFGNIKFLFSIKHISNIILHLKLALRISFDQGKNRDLAKKDILMIIVLLIHNFFFCY